jgi:undecaprenyl-diphosphatase
MQPLIKTRTAELIALARREIGPIAVVMMVGAFFLIFRHIAEEVGEGDTHAFDSAILWSLRVPGHPETPVGPWWLTTALTDVTSLGSVTVLALIVIGVSGLVLSLRRVREAGVLLVASGGGILLITLLKDVFRRDRPPMAFHLVPAINDSFPSGHATLSATVYLTLGVLIGHFAERRRVRGYALSTAVLLTLIVGCSRVYLGVHWPTDVMAGWCVGSAWALICWSAALLWERLMHKKLTTAPKAVHALPRAAQGADAGVLSEGA